MRQQDEHTRFNLKKSELVRVIVQALESLDYHQSAKLLENESGYDLHTSDISTFRNNVIQGNWEQVLSTIHVLNINDDEREAVRIRIFINHSMYDF
jgi:hypothetical protein